MKAEYLRVRSLMQSRIINPAIVRTRDLGHPALRLQKLYSSHQVGLSAFFEYLRRAFRDHRRRFILMRTDDRFSVGIFIRGEVEWANDAFVDDPNSPTRLQPHVQPKNQYRGTQPMTPKQQTTILGYPVDDNVVVCAFMPNSQEKMSPCTCRSQSGSSARLTSSFRQADNAWVPTPLQQRALSTI